MKKVLFTLMGLFCLYQTAFSQQPDTLSQKTIESKALYLTAKLERELVLSGSQVEMLYEIAKERFLSIDNLKKVKKLSEKDLEEINGKAMNKFLTLLTYEQKILFLEDRENMQKAKEKFKEENPGSKAFNLSIEDEELTF
jgi:hypothetical protein